MCCGFADDAVTTAATRIRDALTCHAAGSGSIAEWVSNRVRAAVRRGLLDAAPGRTRQAVVVETGMSDDVSDIACFYGSDPDREVRRLDRHQLERDLT